MKSSQKVKVSSDVTLTFLCFGLQGRKKKEIEPKMFIEAKPKMKPPTLREIHSGSTFKKKRICKFSVKIKDVHDIIWNFLMKLHHCIF